MMNEVRNTVFVFGEHVVVCDVESDMEPAHKCLLVAFAFFMRFEQYGTQGRTQCQGVDGRKTDCEGHRKTELAVERS